MKLTAEQLAEFAKQLSALAAVFNPGAAASIQMLVLAATELNGMVKSIRENDPQLWEKSAANFKEARAAFDASQPGT